MPEDLEFELPELKALSDKHRESAVEDADLADVSTCVYRHVCMYVLMSVWTIIHREGTVEDADLADVSICVYRHVCMYVYSYVCMYSCMYGDTNTGEMLWRILILLV